MADGNKEDKGEVTDLKRVFEEDGESCPPTKAKKMAKVVIITGSSSGIGLETCKILAASGFSVVGTVRDAGKKETTEQHIREAVPGATIRCAILEIGKTVDAEATKSAIRELGEECVGLINNAGLAGERAWDECEDVTDRSIGARILNTNFFGLRAVTHALEPLLAKRGFIVNVSSGAAYRNMEQMAPALVQKMRESEEEEHLDAFAHTFLDRYTCAEKIRKLDESSGFSVRAYPFSKVLVNILTKLHAKKWPERIVTACSPGYTLTPMTAPYPQDRPIKTAKEGAQVVVRAIEGPTGLFFNAETPEGKPLI